MSKLKNRYLNFNPIYLTIENTNSQILKYFLSFELASGYGLDSDPYPDPHVFDADPKP